MERLDYIQIVKILLENRIRLNIIETASVKNDIVQWVATTAPSGFISKQVKAHFDGQDFRNLVASYQQEYELKRRLAEVPNAICSIVHKFGRFQCTSSSVHEVMTKKTQLNDVTGIQQYLAERVKQFTYSLTYINHCYESEYFTHNGSNKVHLTKHDIFYDTISDITNVLLIAIESSQHKRVAKIRCKFAKDSNNILWLHSVTHCKLIEPQLCRLHQFKRPGDLIVLEKSLPRRPTRFSKRTIKTARTAEPFLLEQAKDKYVFRNGRIRNPESNPNSPLRVRSPAEPQSRSKNLLRSQTYKLCTAPVDKHSVKGGPVEPALSKRPSYMDAAKLCGEWLSQEAIAQMIEEYNTANRPTPSDSAVGKRLPSSESKSKPALRRRIKREQTHVPAVKLQRRRLTDLWRERIRRTMTPQQEVLSRVSMTPRLK